MLTRYKRVKPLVKTLHHQANVLTSTIPKEEQLHHESTALQWLTSQTSSSPPITLRLQLTQKTTPASLTIQHKSNQTSYPLPPPLLKKAAYKILSTTRSFLRSPNSLPPVSIEYSSPNIAKPLHMGHLRSTITGSYVKNIASEAGHETRSICFLGDWGRQFGVLHAGVLQKLNNNEDFKTYVSSLSLHQLLSTYVQSSSKCKQDTEFSSEALRLSASLEHSFNNIDSDGAYLWSHTKALTIDHLKSCYDVLGISFDSFEGESTYKRDSDYTTKALETLKALNLTHRHEDGSLKIRIGETECILLKRDNSSVYLLRDIACALNRYDKRNTHKFVYVVDDGQSSHFKNLFNILSTIGIQKSTPTTTDDPPFTHTFTHIPFGKVQGMSTRSGTFTLLSDVIDQGTSLMHESRRKSPNARNIHDMDVSRNLAVCGLIVNALKARRTKTYTFDWNEALRSNGNSGVSLQYTIARVGSLLKRVTGGEDHVVVEDQNLERIIDCLLDCERKDVIELVLTVLNYEDTFWRSYTTLEPCALVSYAFNLSDKISKVLSTVRILDEKDKEFATAMIWLFYISNSTLQKCLKIIGISPVGEF